VIAISCTWLFGGRLFSLSLHLWVLFTSSITGVWCTLYFYCNRLCRQTLLTLRYSAKTGQLGSIQEVWPRKYCSTLCVARPVIVQCPPVRQVRELQQILSIINSLSRRIEIYANLHLLALALLRDIWNRELAEVIPWQPVQRVVHSNWRNGAKALPMPSCRVCLSVRLSVCLSVTFVYIMSKWMNICLNFFHHRVANHSSCFIPNVTAIFRRPPMGASNAGGTGTNRDCRRIAGYRSMRRRWLL